MMGTVFAHGHTYEIASTGNGLHEIRELDPASFPTDDPPLPETDVPPASDQPESGAPLSIPPHRSMCSSCGRPPLAPPLAAPRRCRTSSRSP